MEKSKEEVNEVAALPYMQFYPADYLADTGHLTTEEHGAYLLLLFNYWQTGKPLRADRLATVARLSNERWISVEQTLAEFFNTDVNPGAWTHLRVEADLHQVASKSTKASDAGKKSALARALAKQGSRTNVTTNVATDLQRNANHTDTDTDTDTDKDQKHNVETTSQLSLGSDESETSKTPACPHQRILDLYHSALPELPAVVLLNDARKKHLSARWRESPVHQDLQFWADYFMQVKQSRFLLGQTEGRNGGKPFRATFDWLIAPSNFVKVIEGNYNA